MCNINKSIAKLLAYIAIHRGIVSIAQHYSLKTDSRGADVTSGGSL